ncbi:hypothetical protein BJP36_12100 [Moorena producens JHB]|uniref:Uncharacterized protein n=1 Tax=Moorena producens (strain JHB) TaxID=1454205 RepID=A0A1D9FZG1_MOOP1|nr:hypothetical protein [Moorena producens]AOY80550.2 hypothetical protein BJP36_12100 [Moorena producens JHB]
MDADTKSTTFGAPMLLQLKLKLRKSVRQGARLQGREGLLTALGRTSMSDGNNITYDWTKSS